MIPATVFCPDHRRPLEDYGELGWMLCKFCREDDKAFSGLFKPYEVEQLRRQQSTPDLRLVRPNGETLTTFEVEEQPARSSLVDWSTFWKKDHKDEDFELKPVLARGRYHSLSGPSKGGKSEHAIFWAACLSAGKRVLDRPEGNPVDVVYFDYEQTEGDIWEDLTDMGFGPETDLSRLHYYLLPNLPKFDTPEGGAVAQQIARLHKAAVVFIDTTSRVIQGEENSADTFRALYYNTVLGMKSEGRTVVRLDHTGKDLTKGQRGSSAKTDAEDVVWQLSRREGGAQLRATHRRQSWIPETVSLVRLEYPLRYELAAESWPAGTAELARLLNDLDVPLDSTNRAAGAALKNAGHGTRSTLLAAALKWRREPGNTPGNTILGLSGNTNGNTSHIDSGNARETPGNTPAAGRETCVPLIGDTVTGPPSCPDCGTSISPYQECCARCLSDRERQRQAVKAGR